MDFSRSSMFSDISPQARETKEKINKCDYINQSLCTAKATINHQPAAWENILTKDNPDRGFIYKVYRELIKLNTKKKRDTPSRKWAKDLILQKGPTHV